MELLTIGAFAKASRLSPKALRLYDELGLLTPAQVDPVSGYRLYAPEQLEAARLVAWLRRLGMPLTRIRRVCELAATPEVPSGTPGAHADTDPRPHSDVDPRPHSDVDPCATAGVSATASASAGRAAGAGAGADAALDSGPDPTLDPTPDPGLDPVPGPGPGRGAGVSAAAREVRAYWASVEAGFAARRDLATFLVAHLSRKEPIPVIPMPEHPGTTPSKAATAAALGIRYAALSDTGRVRESNQDALYAGSRLLAVADGFGSGGGPASAAAVEAFRRLEPDAVAAPAGELLNALEDTLAEAGRAVRDVAESGAAPDAVHSAAPGAAHDEVGTTLTALLWTGSRLALVHIGDSRAYVLRGGGLFQITHDHTVVQTMVDEGRLTPEEAASHPQRALLARALTGHGYGTRPGYGTGHGTGTVPDPDPDPNPNPNPNPNPGPDAGTGAELRLHDALPGDRYLLCSDGLSAVVPVPEVRTVLASVPEPRDAVRALVDLANRAGGPDNVSCVVADVVTSG